MATVAALLDEINQACCSSQNCSIAGFKCTPHCGAAVIPAMDMCRAAINYIFVDGDHRGAHDALEKSCLSIPAAPLVTALDRLEQDGCTMEFGAGVEVCTKNNVMTLEGTSRASIPYLAAHTV